MSKALKGFSTRVTPQSEAIPGTDQVPNSAGGFTWAVDKWTRLHRFLILGSDGGSYYASEQKLTRENAGSLIECIKDDGPRTVKIITEISDSGRAPKNDQAIFALALASALGDEKTKQAAYQALPAVCRIGTHLFQFMGFREQFAGWGSGAMRAVQRWYTERDLDSLAYQLIKYRQREGWTHRDVLRVTHPKADDEALNATLRWAVGKPALSVGTSEVLPDIIQAFDLAQNPSTTPEKAAKLVRNYNLPREALQTEHLKDLAVWEAMLAQGMPQTALIRNLATMTRIGLLTPTSDATRLVESQIRNQEKLVKARVHPISILAAMMTYASGHSARGSSTWTPLPALVDALDDAFYASFQNVEATGKRHLLALDVSGSMTMGEVAGVPGLTPRVASAAMAMVTMQTGDPYEVVGFTGGSYWRDRHSSNAENLTVLPLSKRQRLDDVLTKVDGLPFGGTDCALPMLYAMSKSREVDVFTIFTDSETWAGGVHPAQALQQYRQKSGINSKLIVVGMVSNGFSIADPNDTGMLDVVGFDVAAPNVMSAFAKGEF